MTFFTIFVVIGRHITSYIVFISTCSIIIVNSWDAGIKPVKAIKTNIRESVNSPKMVETIALTPNLLFFLSFIFTSILEFTKVPHRYAIKLAILFFGVVPSIVLKALSLVNQLGDGKIMAKLNTNIVNRFMINPKIIIFLDLSKPYTSDMISLII